MKLEKAIETLAGLGDSETAGVDEEEKNALKLGIEALRRIKHDRIINDDLNPYPLQGETKV